MKTPRGARQKVAGEPDERFVRGWTVDPPLASSDFSGTPPSGVRLGALYPHAIPRNSGVAGAGMSSEMGRRVMPRRNSPLRGVHASVGRFPSPPPVGSIRRQRTRRFQGHDQRRPPHPCREAMRGGLGSAHACEKLLSSSMEIRPSANAARTYRREAVPKA